MSEIGRPDGSWLGRQIEVEVGPVAHGGFFIARYDGRVIFVRHALTGERVLALVTEDRGGSFCRADAVQIIVANADRVAPPCEYARPGGCGGCDFQHVSLPRQRALKAAVIAEQLQRLAGVSWQPTVQALASPAGPALAGPAGPALASPAGPASPADPQTGLADDGLGWRRRVRYALDDRGRPGLHRHRSPAVQPLQRCLIAADGVGDERTLADLADRTLTDFADRTDLADRADRTDRTDELLLDVAVDDHHDQAVLAYTPEQRSTPQPSGAPATSAAPSPAGTADVLAGQGGSRRSRQSPLAATAGPSRRRDARQVQGGGTKLYAELLSGPAKLHYDVGGRGYLVTAGGFWQTHPAAAEVFVRAVLDAVQARAGETILDLYAGAGLFSGALAEAVGPTGSVRGLELDAVAVADATANLADLAQVTVTHGAVTPAAVRTIAGQPWPASPSGPAGVPTPALVDAVVLDPPRTGAGRHVMQAIFDVTSRVVVYVACDPASLGRDVGYAREFGWTLTGLQAFDAFPMTHHVECVAVLTPTTPR